MTFKNKSEAEKHVEELRAINPSEFCPLTKENCRKDCVCFQPAHFKPSGQSFYTYEHCCGNAMFSEYRTVENQ